MAISFDKFRQFQTALAESGGHASRFDPLASRPAREPIAAGDPFHPLPPAGSTPDERRQRPRIHERCIAEVAEWFGDRAGTAFGVIVEDISTSGVGLVHTGRLEPGRQYLLEIPRLHQLPLAVVFTVVRCDERDGGLFVTNVAPDDVLSVTVAHGSHLAPENNPSPRRTPLRIAMIVLAFAMSALAVFFNVI